MRNRRPWFVAVGLAAACTVGLFVMFGSCGGKSKVGAAGGSFSPDSGGAPQSSVESSDNVSSTTEGSDSTGGTTGTAATSGACVAVSGDYGDCEAELGWGFDGSRCRLFSGCGCAPDCDRLYPSASGCALACRALGQCNQQALVPTGIAQDFALGSECQSVTACVPAELADQLNLPLVAPCSETARCPSQLTCPIAASATIDSKLWDDLCTASFLPGVELQCTLVLGG